MSKHILFVVHDAGRTGAPMVLLHFIKWIKLHQDVDMTILLKAGGPLQSEFERYGKVFLWRPKLLSASPVRRAVSFILKIFGGERLFVPYPAELKLKRFDLIYLNTAEVMNWAPMLKKEHGAPIVAHIHELSFSINCFYQDAFNIDNISHVQHFIAAAAEVKANLAESYKIAEEKITVINEFIPFNEVSRPSIDASSVKKELGITADLIVGGAGQAGWRKGTDLFLQVASRVLKRKRNIDVVFIWVGHLSAEMQAQTAYEKERLGLDGYVYFTGPKADPQNYFQLFDLFLLTSREDPFPLVCLEAAALHKPIFCFENSGGIPGIIDNENGRKVGYGDIEAMTDNILEFLSDAVIRKKTGEKAAAMVSSYDVNVLAPELYKLIDAQ